jgi:hypothetical protein
MKKQRTVSDEAIRGKIAQALNNALESQGKNAEEAASLLQVEVGTMYKYLAAAMIPGGHVLWRACQELGLILDEKGLRPAGNSHKKASVRRAKALQYELPFINELLADDQVHLVIGKKDVKSTGYVHVSLRIKVAN